MFRRQLEEVELDERIGIDHDLGSSSIIFSLQAPVAVAKFG